LPTTPNATVMPIARSTGSAENDSGKHHQRRQRTDGDRVQGAPLLGQVVGRVLEERQSSPNPLPAPVRSGGRG
jgi:hypothetical protein